MLQFWCECQKQPCTKIAARRRGNTMSGLPGKSVRCKRKRYPIACSALRTARSGLEGGHDALRALLDAERRHTGTLLPEWPFAPWTEPLRTEVEEAHRAVLAGIARELAARGGLAEAISRYRLLIATEPEREGWHREVMRLYVEAGERALALRQYDTCRRLLRERLGIEPSAETRRLHAAILRDG